MNADPDSITVSGFSGGSFFTAFLHTQLSDKIKGVGLFSGGPFYSYTVTEAGEMGAKGKDDDTWAKSEATSKDMTDKSIR